MFQKMSRTWRLFGRIHETLQTGSSFFPGHWVGLHFQPKYCHLPVPSVFQRLPRKFSGGFLWPENNTKIFM
jgi:hypothetical protein